MITAVRTEGTNQKSIFSLYGLSTDQKPTGDIDGTVIENGSSFFEMDTKSVKFYDADSSAWI